MINQKDIASWLRGHHGDTIKIAKAAECSPKTLYRIANDPEYRARQSTLRDINRVRKAIEKEEGK